MANNPLFSLNIAMAIALTHGSISFEVAKLELHATTGLRNQNRHEPTRISFVFYQHKTLNSENNGKAEYKIKAEEWTKRVRPQKLKVLKEYEKLKAELENGDENSESNAEVELDNEAVKREASKVSNAIVAKKASEDRKQKIERLRKLKLSLTRMTN